jgi:hypothetical protein
VLYEYYAVAMLGEEPLSSLVLVFLKNAEQCSEKKYKEYILAVLKQVVAPINYVQHTGMYLSYTTPPLTPVPLLNAKQKFIDGSG